MTYLFQTRIFCICVKFQVCIPLKYVGLWPHLLY